MQWQQETDAQVVVGGQTHPVRAAYSTYSIGPALRWHGTITTRDAGVRRALFEAADARLRLPSGWEGEIHATASASGGIAQVAGEGSPDK
ncbi:hypothetical protein [Streptomyces sp. UH6]|uniref:hypothetical protein n=1 Tax=Streptomyces sp. UH6 TaxID=2748379 RepID=UPI0015D4C658|nr:hypothetical protein [Streptomyces sp. UH6]NYV73689.1 hypothetical protein [Streptomyces sp. UH6]